MTELINFDHSEVISICTQRRWGEGRADWKVEKAVKPSGIGQKQLCARAGRSQNRQRGRGAIQAGLVNRNSSFTWLTPTYLDLLYLPKE